MLTLGTKVICSGGRYGYSLQSGREGKCRVTLRAGRRIGYPLLSQPTPWKGLEQGMRPGTRRPRSPTVSPTPAPPAFARRGVEPSLVPHAEGLPGAGPRPRVLRLQQEQRDHQRRRRRQRSAQGCGPGHPAIPPPRRFPPLARLCGAPPRSAPIRLHLPGDFALSLLTPPTGAGCGGVARPWTRGCLGAGVGGPEHVRSTRLGRKMGDHLLNIGNLRNLLPGVLPHHLGCSRPHPRPQPIDLIFVDPFLKPVMSTVCWTSSS